MRVTIKMGPTIQILERKRDVIARTGAAITLSNFQKNQGQLYTSAKTICEIDFEVLHTGLEFVIFVHLSSVHMFYIFFYLQLILSFVFHVCRTYLLLTQQCPKKICMQM